MIASMWLLNGFTDPALFRDADISRLFAIFQLIFLGTACGACEAECPVSAISEGDGKYEINPDVCTECGSCADVCPVGAPQAD